MREWQSISLVSARPPQLFEAQSRRLMSKRLLARGSLGGMNQAGAVLLGQNSEEETGGVRKIIETLSAIETLMYIASKNTFQRILESVGLISRGSDVALHSAVLQLSTEHSKPWRSTGQSGLSGYIM